MRRAASLPIPCSCVDPSWLIVRRAVRHARAQPSARTRGASRMARRRRQRSAARRRQAHRGADQEGDRARRRQGPHLAAPRPRRVPLLDRRHRCCLLVWSLLVDAPLEEPANPTRTPNPSKAPWYFLGLQEMLVFFDPWHAGVVLPSFIIVGLMVHPVHRHQPEGERLLLLQGPQVGDHHLLSSASTSCGCR